MKRNLTGLLAIAMAVLCLVGCGHKSKRDSRGPSPKQNKVLKLANGTEFSVSVEGASKGERCWIWCDLAQGEVSYRVVGKGQPADWKPLMKVSVSKDAALKVTPDVEGMYGDALVLPRGQYTVDFKVGNEVLPGLPMEVD